MDLEIEMSRRKLIKIKKFENRDGSAYSIPFTIEKQKYISLGPSLVFHINILQLISSFMSIDTSADTQKTYYISSCSERAGKFKLRALNPSPAPSGGSNSKSVHQVIILVSRPFQ